MFQPINFLVLLIVGLMGYFIGNISPAILIGKAHGIDIKKEGSGNAGTTNVLRVLGKKAAIGTLIIDIGKGVVAVLLGRLIGHIYASGIQGMTEERDIAYVALSCAMLAGLCVFIGHIWPMAFGFKGGKGVATAFGVLVAIHPLLGLSCLAVVAIVALVSKMVSLGSICGAIALPLLSMAFQPDFFFTGLIMSIIVIVKHRQNISRIMRGEESKLFTKKKKKNDEE